ncbi:hypothetical protein GQ600_7013 [Phytophthora cactorum]|nr:hypothetical protein GQ600_7013 [Phytophthora cactorum]
MRDYHSTRLNWVSAMYCSTDGRVIKLSVNFVSHLVKTTKPAVLTAFCSDNLTQHLLIQHPQRWSEYSTLPLVDINRKILRSENYKTFLPSQPAFPFVSLWFSDCIFADQTWPLDDAFDEQDDGSSVTTVANRDQFETSLECVSSSMSDRCTAK